MQSNRGWFGRVLAGAAVAAVGGVAWGQTAPLESRQAPVQVDSRWVQNTGAQPEVVFITEVHVPDAPWLRLKFDEAVLSGFPGGANESILRITSMKDGAQQRLNARHVQEWYNTSAYFNGDTVLVEIVAHPGTGRNRLVMSEVTAGVFDAADSLCDGDDKRVLSQDPRAARLLPIGCTAWLYEDPIGCGNATMTAGHCISAGTSNAVIQFNVPLSSSTGGLNHPPPEDQYSIEQPSIQTSGSGGVGNDYARMYHFANANTGMTAFEAMGDRFILAGDIPQWSPTHPGIRVTGYGTTSAATAPREWNQVQKTDVGEYHSTTSGTSLRYRPDTTGGNSGSPVIDEGTGLAVGVHTHGGCTSTGGANQGTGINHTGWQNWINNPIGTCIPVGLKFDIVGSLPAMVDPAGGDRVEVVVESRGTNDPEPGTGMFHYDIGAGWVSEPMTQTAPNEYFAEFPATDCETQIHFYFSAKDTTGKDHFEPINAPTTFFTTLSGYGTVPTTLMTEDFESGIPANWTATGLWHVTDRCGPSQACGSSTQWAYFGQSGRCDYHTTRQVVGDLESPQIQLPPVPFGGAITLTYCSNRETEENQQFDVAEVWVNNELVDEPDQSEEWQVRQVDLTQFGGQAVTIRFHFDSKDGINNTFRGWQIDNIELVATVVDCADCYPDCNDDGVLDFFDFLCFQNEFLAGSPYADCDGNNQLDFFDFLCFQNEFLAGCP